MSNAKQAIEELREIEEIANKYLDYRPDTGEFRWKLPRWNAVKKGDPAGYDDRKGYRQIQLEGRRYLAHRLAWLMTYGRWPKDQIDHINGDRADNRLSNLREVTRFENQQNRQRHRDGEVKGFSKHYSKYKSRIRVNGKYIYLGLYATPEEAHSAYLSARKEMHHE